MATKAEVETFLHSKYRIETLDGGMMKLIFDQGDGRSQLVWVWLSDNVMYVSSPIAQRSEVSADHALEVVSKYSLGMQVLGDFYVLRHVAYLADLDASEAILAVEITTNLADDVEKELVGGDKY